MKFSYNKIVGIIKRIVDKLKSLKKNDEFRIKKTNEFLEKLYQIGLIKNRTNLKDADLMGISTFCRRRLAFILFKNKYCESIKQAVSYIEQGQIRITVRVHDKKFKMNKQMPA